MSMSAVWASVFGLVQEHTVLEDQVVACLMALRQQIDFTRVRLDDRGVPGDLTSPGFERLKAVASPTNINSGWNGHRASMTAPDTRHAFMWAAWVLRDEDEGDMSAEDATALRDEIEALEDALRTADLPPYLRDFLGRQVDTIRAALRLYRIQGVRPLHEAMQKVAGSFSIEGGRVRAEAATASPEGRTVMKQASEMLAKLAHACDSLDKVMKLGNGLGEAAASISRLLT